MEKEEFKGGTIWAEGTHGIFVDGKPSKVYVNRESLERTFNDLKDRLPIPLGIDHLQDETLRGNPILRKLDLLNVGEIKAVSLEDEGIKITEATINNPSVKELYAKGGLPSFSVVSDIFTRDCPELKADYVEEYSRIKRVDFVEVGGCSTCTVDQPRVVNAKSIINLEGDGILSEEDIKKKEGLEGAGEPDKLDLILEEVKGLSGRVSALEEAGTPEGEEGEEGEEDKTGELNPEISKLQSEMEELKVEARKAEARGIVKGFLQAGKIAPKNVEQHEALAFKSPEEYQALMKDAPVIIDLEKKSKSAEAKKSGEKVDKSYGAFLEATGQNKKEE